MIGLIQFYQLGYQERIMTAYKTYQKEEKLNLVLW